MQEQIILLLKSRDKAAIELLYDHYAKALFGVVLRIVHSRELAEQVMQDTFVKAWRCGENFDESKGRLFTWLLKIARNTAIDATRTSHFRQGQRTDSLNETTCPGCGHAFNADTLGLRELVGGMDEKIRPTDRIGLFPAVYPKRSFRNDRPAARHGQNADAARHFDAAQIVWLIHWDV